VRVDEFLFAHDVLAAWVNAHHDLGSESQQYTGGLACAGFINPLVHIAARDKHAEAFE
jgi:hypothetical protein